MLDYWCKHNSRIILLSSKQLTCPVFQFRWQHLNTRYLTFTLKDYFSILTNLFSLSACCDLFNVKYYSNKINHNDINHFSFLFWALFWPYKIDTAESKTANLPLLLLYIYKKSSLKQQPLFKCPFFHPHGDKVCSERTNHLFVWCQQRKTWGTGAPDEMSDGRKCFQQLLLQWVEHIQSIPKQIKSSGQSEWGWGRGVEPAATELDGDRRNTMRCSTFEVPHEDKDAVKLLSS